MGATTVNSRKKIIDLKDETFKALSMLAVQNGTNLKHYIETTLDRIAENYADKNLYAYMEKNYPDGKEPLNDTEKKQFEDWLGV